MQKLNYKIVIKAPKEKVWKTMLEKETYEQWTKAFSPSGSTYEGSWSEGSDIKFVGPNGDGTFSGMQSRIKTSRPYDFISIQHLGEINKGEVTMWYGEGTKNIEAFENYTFNEVPGGTEVLVDLTAGEGFPYDYKEILGDAWPKALQALKALAEK